MFMTKALARLTMFAGLMALPSAIPTAVYAQQAVTVGATDIGGTVVGAAGPEAGVWVIAETTDLPTKFARIVVTDDQGRYLIPDLPAANYSVWVRGYGLVDSAKLTAKPGQLLNHTAVPAPNEAAAAHYYPAIYWYAMMKIPPAGDFGGKSDIPEKLTQTDWLKQMKNIGCIGCHQLGQEATRTIPAAFGKFDSGEAAWMRRVQSGQSGEQMTNQLAGNFGGAPFKYLGDWTDRVAKGELPKSQAATSARRRTQYRDHFLGVVDARQIPARSDFVRPAQSDGQCLWPALRLAGIFDRQHADPGSEDEQSVVLQDAGRRSRDAGIIGSRTCRQREAAGAVGLLGRAKTLGYASQQPQLHVRREGPALALRHRARHG